MRARRRPVPVPARSVPLATLAALLAPCAAAQVPGAAFQAVGDLPGGAVASFATALSPDGAWVVGHGESAAGTQAFRWSAATGIQGLGDLPGGGSYSNALAVVEGGGLVCGESDAFEGRIAYSWHAGYGMIAQGWFDPDDPRSVMTDLDASGCLGVGWSRLFGQDVAAIYSPCGGTAWWFYLEDEPSGGTRAHAVAAFGDVAVGEALVGGSWRACRWDHPYAGAVRTLLDAPGSPLSTSTALRCSTDGEVAVGFGYAGGQLVATRWDAGGLTVLAPGGGVQPLKARGVSGTGARVVGLGLSGGVATAWIQDAAGGVRALREVMEADYGLALDGWTLYEACDVSGDGQTITGTGLDPQGHLAAWVAVLPIACRADVNGDGVVNLGDVAAFSAAYTAGTALGDFDGNGFVGLSDVAAFTAAWQAGC